MANKNDPRGEVRALDAAGQAVTIRVFWKRGSTYLTFGGRDHVVHFSNLGRERGFAIEAICPADCGAPPAVQAVATAVAEERPWT